MTTEDLAKVSEIIRLLDEAYDHYFHFDDHCKRSEGYIELHGPNYFDRKAGARLWGIGIYSYVLGRSRMHYFATIDEALTEVRQWHAEEMQGAEKSEVR